jgi:hypothetical protein
MAMWIRISTGWINLDTVAAATTREGSGEVGLRFAGSTEFAYLDVQDSAIMREALDAASVNAGATRDGATAGTPAMEAPDDLAGPPS